MNRYSLWMNLLVVGVLLFGALIAAPNLFGDDPALQITREDGTALDQMTVSVVTARLDADEIAFNAADVEGGAVLVRFPDVDSQLRGSAALGEELP
ncbi:MAG: protein translocase subunit SecD, partial [Gammaproteobacteria bacterium]|nr:protein translocase subunit SecD [Gammaproteobacteria bacterium]